MGPRLKPSLFESKEYLSTSIAFQGSDFEAIDSLTASPCLYSRANPLKSVKFNVQKHSGHRNVFHGSIPGSILICSLSPTVSEER